MIAAPSILIPRSPLLRRLHELREWILFTTGKGQQNSTSHRGKINSSTGRAKYDGGSGCTSCGCGGLCSYCTHDFTGHAVVTLAGILSCGRGLSPPAGTLFPSQPNGSYTLGDQVTPCDYDDGIFTRYVTLRADPTYGLMLIVGESTTGGALFFCGNVSLTAPFDCSSGTYTINNLLTSCTPTTASACMPSWPADVWGYNGTATLTL